MMKNNQSPKLTILSIILLIIGGGSLFIKGFLPEYVDAQGFLIEPYFFLIPIGFFIVFLGLIIGAIAFIRNMTGLRK